MLKSKKEEFEKSTKEEADKFLKEFKFDEKVDAVKNVAGFASTGFIDALKELEEATRNTENLPQELKEGLEGMNQQLKVLISDAENKPEGKSELVAPTPTPKPEIKSEKLIEKLKGLNLKGHSPEELDEFRKRNGKTSFSETLEDVTQQDVDNVIDSIEKTELSVPQSRGLPSPAEQEIKNTAEQTISQPTNFRSLSGNDTNVDPATKVRNDNPTLCLISRQTIFAV